MRKQITIKRKLALVFSMIIKDTISQIRSLDRLMTRNFIPASCLPYKYFLNTIYTIILSNDINNTIMKLSRKFMLQK